MINLSTWPNLGGTSVWSHLEERSGKKSPYLFTIYTWKEFVSLLAKLTTKVYTISLHVTSMLAPTFLAFPFPLGCPYVQRVQESLYATQLFVLLCFLNLSEWVKFCRSNLPPFLYPLFIFAVLTQFAFSLSLLEYCTNSE